MGDGENAKWTERCVLMDVTIKKRCGKTTRNIESSHPIWVTNTIKGIFTRRISLVSLPQTYILRFFREDGSHRDQLDSDSKENIDTLYKEMNEHVGLVVF